VANEIQISSATKEALKGDSVGRVIKGDVGSAVRENLTGDSAGRDIMANAVSTVREVVTGDGVGSNTPASVYSAAREILTGDSVGVTFLAGVATVVREILSKEPPLRISSAVRENVVSIPDDPITVSHIIPSYRQTAVQRRPTMALPSTVKSMEMVFSLRELAVQRLVRFPSISFEYAMTLRMQTVMRLTTAPTIRSPITTGSYRQLAVLSRTHAHVPVSAVYAATQQQLAVLHRVVVPAPDVRTAIRVGTQQQVVVLSRRVDIPVILTDAFVHTQVQQIVLEDTRPAPHSPIDAATLVQMTVQRHNVVPPGIDDRVGAQVQQVVIERVPAVVHGPDIVAQYRQQITLGRAVPASQRSPLYAAGGVMLVAQHRESIPPQYALGWRVNTMRQQIVQERPAAGAYRSQVEVGSMRITFVLHRVTPLPIDVIDPSVGRHVGQYQMLAVQHRVTLPPEVISAQTRFVYQLVGQVAVGDIFPPPDYPPPEPPISAVFSFGELVMVGDNAGWVAVSAVTVQPVIEQVVVGDDIWIDPTVPLSSVDAFGVYAALAVGDVFADPASLLSEAQVDALGQAVVIGDDSMPDPALPLSEIQVSYLVEMPLVGDVSLPDPTIPQSEVIARSLAAFAVLGDDSLVGEFPMSPLTIPCLAQVFVLGDRDLRGVPLRYGPRPVVTVSMS
jgi:hypothetical protein